MKVEGRRRISRTPTIEQRKYVSNFEGNRSEYLNETRRRSFDDVNIVVDGMLHYTSSRLDRIVVSFDSFVQYITKFGSNVQSDEHGNHKPIIIVEQRHLYSLSVIYLMHER